MTRALLIGILLVATAAAAEQIIPVSLSPEASATHELRLHNMSPSDAVAVTFVYESDGHSAAGMVPVRMGAGEEIILADVVRQLFGMTPDTVGEIRVQAPENVEVQWRLQRPGFPDRAWLPSVTSKVALATVGRKRRAVCSGCRIEPPTLVKAGDVATFAGSHGVGGMATIIDRSSIRVSGLRHDGSAPGLDIRVGLSTTSRKNFVVLRVTGRQPFQNATFDLALPGTLDLNSFDTFTVWCYEFNTIIAEGKFNRP